MAKIIEVPNWGRVEFPDDMPDDQIVAAIKKNAMGYSQDTEKPVTKYDPTEGMSGTDKFLAGMGKAFTDLGRGGGQLIRSVMGNSLSDKLGLPTERDVSESRRLDAPLMNTGAGITGNITGNISAAIPTAFIPGAATIPGAALTGAVLGSMSPVTEGESRLQNTALGGALGGGSVLAGRVLVAGAKGAKSLVEPFTTAGQNAIVGRTLNRFGRMGKSVDIPTNTAGWSPTLAEKTQNPGFAILQRGAQSADPDTAALLSARGLEQNAAAINALEKLGGTSQDMGLAKGVRSLMSEQLYKEAAQEGVSKEMSASIAPQIKNLMERPSMIKAAEKAKDIFGEESVALAKSGSVKGLQYMKQSLDDMIEKASGPSSSIGKNQLRALQHTRSDLISIIEDVAPKQRMADVNYRTFSSPINEMEAARALLDKVRGPLMDFAPGAPGRLRADQYAGALRNLEDQLPRMTGFPGATIENTMSPGGLNTVHGIAKDLAARAQSMELAKGIGSNTAQNLASQNIMRQLFGPMGMPERFMESQVMPTLIRPLQYGMKAQEPAIQQKMAQALLDPELAAQLMRQNLTPYAPGLLMQGVTRMMPPVSLGLLGVNAGQ